MTDVPLRTTWAASKAGRLVVVVIGLLLSASGLVWGNQSPTDSRRAGNTSSTCTARERIVVGTVGTMTFPNGSLAPDSLGAAPLAGLRFWADRANELGGVKVGSRHLPVDIVGLDDSCDEAKAKQLFEKLISVHHVDLIVAGGAVTDQVLQEVVQQSQVVVMVPTARALEPSPMLFQMHASLDAMLPVQQVSDFIAAGIEQTGMSQVFEYYDEGPGSQETCEFAKQVWEAGMPNLQINSLNGISPGRWKDAVGDDFTGLVLCTASDKSSVGRAASKMLDFLIENGILYGWDTDATDVLSPSVVESPTSIQFAHFTDADLRTNHFFERSSGWVNRLFGHDLWKAEFDHADPLFGSALRAEEMWKQRSDFGRGEGMTAATASAVGAGVVFQLAVEAAEGTEAERLAAAMKELDEEVLYGRVRFDERGLNEGHESYIYQWVCDASRAAVGQPSCWQRTVYPFQYATGLPEVYPRACPTGSIRASLLEAVADADDSQYQVETAESEFPAGCTACAAANPAQVRRLLALGKNNRRSLQFSCPVFRETVAVGALLSGAAAEGVRVAQTAAAEALFDALPNVPLQLQLLEEAADAGGAAGLLRVVSETREYGPKAAFVWDAAEVEEAHGSWRLREGAAGGSEQARGPTNPQDEGKLHREFQVSQVMFTVGNTSVSLVPPASAEAKALVRMMEHFGWGRCVLIQGAGADDREMGDEFVAEARAREVEVLERVVVPAATDARRAEALASLRSIDDCQARVLVLCLSAADAEAAWEALKGDGAWGGRWVFLASAAAAQAEETRLPPGLLAVRAVVRKGSQFHSDLTTHLRTRLASEAGGRGSDADSEAFYAFDAFLAASKVLWRLIVRGEYLSSPAALLGALQEVQFEGASGKVRFDARGERNAGRFALLNWDGVQWKSIAAWDLEKSGMVLHTTHTTLRQSQWEVEAVFWGAPTHTAKPQDVCECVLFSAIPATSMDIRSCTWSPVAVAAVAVLVLSSLLCAACCVQCWQRRTKHVDVEEDLVQEEVQKLRARLHIRRRDGFILSTEPPRTRWWVPQHAQLQRAHVEAAARMSLLLEFDVRAVDTLANTLYSVELHQQGDQFVGTHQYGELRELVLELSRVLLQPAAGHVHASAAKRSSAISDVGSFAGSQTSLNSGSRTLLGYRSHARALRQEQPRTAEERFHYFLLYISKLQMWAEDDHQLFSELQSTVVQELMGHMREQCDKLYETIVQEDGGPALVAFQWPEPPWRPPRLESASLTACPPGHEEGSERAKVAGPGGPEPEHPAQAPLADAPSCQTETAQENVWLGASSGSLRGPSSTSEYASITRQDHPRVQAIRCDEDDAREMDMHRQSHSLRNLNAMGHEELYLTALHRRALLLNDGFQAAVRAAIENQFGPHPLQTWLRPTPKDTSAGAGAGTEKADAPAVVHVSAELTHALLLERRVHSAPVKTMARMREKLVEYGHAPPHSSPALARPDAKARNLHAHPLAANLLDPVRCTVVCRGPREIREYVQWLLDEGERVGLPVVRLKNKFGLASADEYDGYRDVMACVLYTASNGLKIIGEIQFHDHRLHELKMQMHKLYKVKRAHSAKLI